MFDDREVFGDEYFREGPPKPIRILRDLFRTTERITWQYWFEDSCCTTAKVPTEEHGETLDQADPELNKEPIPAPVNSLPSPRPEAIPVDVPTMEEFMTMLDCEITSFEEFEEYFTPYEWITGCRWRFYSGAEEFWAESQWHHIKSVCDYGYRVHIRKATTMAALLAGYSRERRAYLEGRAKAAAEFFGSFQCHDSRSVQAWSHTIIVFGSGYDDTDARTQREVQLVRDHLVTLGLRHSAFGATSDGNAWAIVALNYERERIDIDELRKNLKRIYNEVWHAKATAELEEAGK